MKKSLDPNITTQQLMELDYKYDYSAAELLSDWRRLQQVTKFKDGSQFKPGMKLCQHFFPNFWDIQNTQGQSFAQAWKDQQIMDRVRTWGLASMSQLWLSWIRRAVYMNAGLPNSSFYRPHFSKQICLMTKQSSGTLFDPCAGWGGRLLGTVAAGWSYVGCEPNAQTYDNLCRLVEFLGIEDRVQIFNLPVENVALGNRRFDVVLTSPPYFDLEIYTKDPNQCYQKYASYDAWWEGWLSPIINKCLKFLSEDYALSCWNVQNVKNRELAQQVIDLHERKGWELTTTVGFRSPLNNIRTLKNKDVTYVFKKNHDQTV